MSENRPSTQIFAEASFFNEFMSSVIKLELQIVVILWPTSAEKLVDVTVTLRICYIATSSIRYQIYKKKIRISVEYVED